MQTEITIGKGSTAGLLLYYSDKAFAGLTSDGSQLFIYSSSTERKVLPCKLGRHMFVRLHNRANTLAIGISHDGNSWQTVAEGIDVSQFHHNNHGGFYALRPALAVSPYLMVFHHDDTHSLHMAVSRMA